MELKEAIEKKIEALYSDINNLNKVKQLTEIYPTLKESSDRWSSKYYSTSEINHLVDKVYFKHSCGCCSDAPLLAFFYKDIDGIQIFSDPYSIKIGESNANGIGDYPDFNWRKKLEKYNIPKVLVKDVENYFEENFPEDYDEENDLD